MLKDAASLGDLAKVKELLSDGLDVNARDNVGFLFASLCCFIF